MGGHIFIILFPIADNGEERIIGVNLIYLLEERRIGIAVPTAVITGQPVDTHQPAQIIVAQLGRRINHQSVLSRQLGMLALKNDRIDQRAHIDIAVGVIRVHRSDTQTKHIAVTSDHQSLGFHIHRLSDLIFVVSSGDTDFHFDSPRFILNIHGTVDISIGVVTDNLSLYHIIFRHLQAFPTEPAPVPYLS